jgi:hypothetical protein
VRTLGWRHPFIEKDFFEVREWLVPIVGDDAPTVRVLDSAIASRLNEHLALTTSMHDLLFTARPIGDPPYDLVIVRSIGSPRRTPLGKVRIETLTHNGKNTDIVRDESETVALFWRFMREKYGLNEPT